MKSKGEILNSGINALYKISNFLKRTPLAFSRKKAMLKKNESLNNKYIGQRCFILANGPSVKMQDLSVLKNEYVFTMNGYHKMPCSNEIDSFMHCMVDSRYFTDEELNKGNHYIHKELVAALKHGSKEGFLFPLSGKERVEEILHDEGLCRDIHYIDFSLTFHEGYKKPFNLAMPFPGFQTVSAFATAAAMGMGFNPIYLLGCDMTLHRVFDVYENKNIEFHAYKNDPGFITSSISLTKEANDIEAIFKGIANIFTHFRYLRSYADNNNIDVYNASEGGLLLSFNCVELKTII